MLKIGMAAPCCSVTEDTPTHSFNRPLSFVSYVTIRHAVGLFVLVDQLVQTAPQHLTADCNIGCRPRELTIDTA
jgi:hypothetical protein